jgi:DNA-binding response OmpR family regulator
MVIKKKVALIVDDDPDFCILVRTILEAKGMGVVAVSSISHAKDYLEIESPNIILLDMELQNENGTDFLKERASNIIWSKIPVIVCSSQSVAAIVKAAIKFGADDYLLKPIKQTWLIQRIRKNLLKEEGLEFNFSDDEEIEVLVDAKAVSVSKTSFMGRSSIGFETGALVTAIIPTEGSETSISQLKSDEKSRYSSKGPFDTLFSVASITESEQKRVQLLKTFWKPS